MINAGTFPQAGKPCNKYFLLVLQILYSGLFIFPILPLKASTSILILFITGVLLLMLIYRQPGFLKTVKANYFFILPFIPYLIEFIIFPHNGIARFALEKKLLLFIGPVIFPLFLPYLKESWKKLPIVIFPATMLVITTYTVTRLMIDGTITDMNSYTNEAYILRRQFELVSHLHPTYYSMFCVTSMMFMLTSMNGLGTGMKILFIFLSLILTIGILVVGAKIGLIILAICLIVYIVRIRLKKSWKIFLLSAFVLLGGVLLITLPSLKARVEGLFTPGRAESNLTTINQRIIIFDCSVKIFSDHILQGIGSRNAQIHLDECYNTRQGTVLATDMYNAHNQFLTIGINYGIFILLIFLFSLSKAGWTLVKDPVGLYFMISVLVVFLTESILECQMGVYFFTLFMTYFYTLRKN